MADRKAEVDWQIKSKILTKIKEDNICRFVPDFIPRMTLDKPFFA